MGLENITLLTYTNSKCSDIHDSYFDRVKKYFTGLQKQIVVCDSKVDGFTNHIYSDDDDFYHHILDSLSLVETDYIIYSQEDYILFDYVKPDLIYKYIDLMDNDKSISFIRLIRSGITNDSNKYNDDLFIIDRNENYYYSTQATIWRKDIILKMFQLAKPKSIRDEFSNSKYLLDVSVNGLCSYLNGEKVGGHYNSYSYPYIATAIVQGKWNTLEYKDELDIIFNDYNIDKNIRGVNG